jgi:hypothetical protein
MSLWFVSITVCRDRPLFRSSHQGAIDARAKKIARMIVFICDGLRSKNYDDFVATFSNPWKQPDASERHARQVCFQMRISDACWYDALIQYPSELSGTPEFYIRGDGDDWGVVISGRARADQRVTVDLHAPADSHPGRDARAMVRALQALPGWSRISELERTLGLVD